MKLYGHQDSGHAYKVALALHLGDIPYEYQWINIWAARETRPRAFLEMSEWAEVPCLIIDGKPYTQSGAILLKLARDYNALKGGEMLDELSKWVNWEANRIGMCVPQLIYAKRMPDEVPPPVQNWLMGRYEIDIERLNATLDQSAFLLGDQISLADICVFGYMSKAHEVDLPVPKNTHRWLEAIKSQPGYLDAKTLLAN